MPERSFRRALPVVDDLSVHMTVPRDLAERLVEHYADDPDVSSVPDALRAAGRDTLRRNYHDE